MHNARGMRDDQHFGDLLRDGDAIGGAEAGGDRLVERLPFDQFQHQPVAVAALDVVVDAADVRVIEVRENLGFPEESGFGLAVQAVLRANGLEGDAALQRLVDARIHLAHAATAEPMEHTVVGDAERQGFGVDAGSIAEQGSAPAAVRYRATVRCETPRVRGAIMHRRLVVFAVLFVGAGFAALAQDRPLNKPPAGFTSLFNGKDLGGWAGRQGTYSPYEQAKLTPEQLAAKKAEWNADRDTHWRVDTAKGEIVSDGQGVHLATEAEYADFELYVDWLMVSPNGDSGIYLRSFPQVQIWDPANPKEAANGADRGSGALWNNNPDNPGKWPLVKADNPVGQWNTLRVQMRGNLVSIWLNGKQTVKGQVLDNFFDRTKPVLPRGQIELQTHGSEIRFRNIYVREIKGA